MLQTVHPNLNFPVLMLWLTSLGLVSCASLEMPVDPYPESTRSIVTVDSGDSATVAPRFASRRGQHLHGYYTWWTRGLWLHLDFEWFLPAADSLQEGFHAYLDSLAVRVEREIPEAALSVFVPGLQMSGMIDVSRIPGAFREIMVQGYDIHWQNGPSAGPLAPIAGWPGADWERIADSMAVRGVAPDRIVMTVPFYGYEWPVEDDQPGSPTKGVARTVTFARVDSLNLPEMHISARDRVATVGLQRDGRSGSPFYAFSDSTGWTQGWFEDEQSLAAKYRFVRERSMRGVAIFPIGYDASHMDGLLLESFGSRRQDQ